VSGQALAAIVFWAVLLLVPMAVGVFAYRLGRMWPAQVVGLALLAYTVAVPFLLGHEPGYCHGQPDCPDPPGGDFLVVLIWMWLAAIGIAATVGGIFGDNSAPMADDQPERLFIGRARRPLPPRR